MLANLNNVLVLGSSGLIGGALCDLLESKGVNVARYDIKRSLSEDISDDKVKRYLMDAMWKSDFVYFLAFDVGGSRYLENNQDSFAFIHNNTKMMVNVFDILSITKTPHIFASSMMAGMNWSPYGQLKRLGESYVDSLKNGKSVRFWNVYGYKEESEKTHVIPDFTRQAIRTGKIEMLTTGTESRQFLHVNDAVEALEAIRLNGMGGDIPSVIDVSSGVWTTIREVAEKVSFLCSDAEIIEGSKVDLVQQDSKLDPNLSTMQCLLWEPKIGLTDGIKLTTFDVKLIEWGKEYNEVNG